jgi:molybdate transport system substrate-binding protein
MNEPSSQRPRAVLWPFMALAGVTLLFGVFVLLRGVSDSKPARAASLVVYCAAGLREPVEAAAKAYEKEFGTRIELSFGGSQTLLANIEVSQTGDVFIPADESYIEFARAKKLAAEVIPLAEIRPLLAVKKGNPKRVQSLSDLARAGIKLSQANPDAAAIGKVVRATLQKSGQWDTIAARTTVFKGTVNDALNDVVLGATDAAFAWDALQRQYSALEFIAVPEFSNAVAHVSLTVLATSKHPSDALKFARYVSARDKGLQEFSKQGFRTAQGDAWSEAPELNVFAGAMLRPAIEQTIANFEKREGARVNRVYNGCGILVAEMRTGKHPDAYLACDTSFMNQVSDLFLDATNLSANQLVILVPKGNPRGIKALRDLAQPRLRLGVGHEKQCALGVLTKNTLMTNGTYFAVRQNVAVESPTGDFLVNQLRAKSLDAVIAYVSNAAGSANELEAIAIDIPCAIAAQPIAPARDTKYPQLTARLIAALRSAESKERFLLSGFRWAAD